MSNDEVPPGMDDNILALNKALCSNRHKYVSDVVSMDTEDSVAEYFASINSMDLRFVARWGKWLQWNGMVWIEDDTLAVFDAVRKVCREVFSSDPKLRSKMLNARTIAAVEKLTRADRRIAATADQWDRDDWILNTPGGIVDLKTGEISPHNPGKHCTKITAASPGGDCPHWNQFLNDITNGDSELIGYLKRVAGYACTGLTREHALFFCYGTGGNGKGTFLNILQTILRAYAVTASMDVFTESRHVRHPTELASLLGARLVIAQEVDEERRWDEAKIKTLTGGDSIATRFMRQDFFTYIPKFTLLIAGNHKPSLRNVDEAMRRRLFLIPFTVTIPKHKRDPELAEKLQAESEGIMQWMIDGSVEYQEKGLAPPHTVTDATAAYFEDEDSLKQWMADHCKLAPGEFDSPTRLFNSWKNYAMSANLEPGDNKAFKGKLEAAGFRQGNSSGKGGRHYMGICLRGK